MTNDTHFSITIKSSGIWEIAADRRLNEATGRGAVVVKLPAEPDPRAPRHGCLAEGRAWLEAGQALSATGDVAGALEAARDGLEALGRAYSRRRNVDDTELKLRVGATDAGQGNIASAAAIYLRVLDERCRAYAALHRSEVLS